MEPGPLALLLLAHPPPKLSPVPCYCPSALVKGGRQSWRPSITTVGWRDVLMVACGAEGEQEWLLDK